MDTLEHLAIFSIGKNEIVNLESVSAHHPIGLFLIFPLADIPSEIQKIISIDTGRKQSVLQLWLQTLCSCQD